MLRCSLGRKPFLPHGNTEYFTMSTFLSILLVLVAVNAMLLIASVNNRSK